MTLPGPFILAMAAAFGAVVGSFLNVCIYRLPREGMTVGSPKRSHCPSCGFAIPWLDNVPILSWLSLAGHCRSCRAPISSRYLLIEALTAMVFAVLADRYLLQPDPEYGLFVVVIFLSTACIVASFIDQDLQIIPDEITMPGMMSVPIAAVLVPSLHLPASWPVADLLVALRGPLGRAGEALPPALRSPAGFASAVAAAAIVCGIGAGWGYLRYWRAVHPKEPKRARDGLLAGELGACVGGALAALCLRPDWALDHRYYSLWAALMGMAAGSTLVFLVGAVARQVFRKDAMGFGDVKLMGFLGGMIGWSGVMIAFLLACLLGSVVGIYRLLRYRSRYLPFGPYLVMGSLIVLLWPGALREAFRFYASLFGG